MNTITKIFAICPHCGESAGQICHLDKGREFGPWHCDSCNGAYKGIYNGVETVIEKTISSMGKKTDILVLLEFPPSDKPIRFIMNGTRYGDEIKPGSTRYFYEDHSCPTNWIGNARMISFDGDCDPHGFLRYVREIDTPELPEDCMEEDAELMKLFPEVLQ